jgi:hypothetical protein
MEVVAGIVGLLAGICSTDISFDERWQGVTQEGWNDSKQQRADDGALRV